MFHDFYFQFCGTSSAPAFQELYHRLIRYIWVFVIFIFSIYVILRVSAKVSLKLGSMANRLLILRAPVTPREKEYTTF